MDGTLARFHDEVNYLERMWEPGFFLGLQPFDTVVEAIKMLAARSSIDVYILSSAIPNASRCTAEKNAWLDSYLPEIRLERRIFPTVGASKVSAVPGGIGADDCLLDDYNRPLREWAAAGGVSIKCHNNINQRGTGAYGGDRGNLWTGPIIHVDDRPEDIFEDLLAQLLPDVEG